MDIATYGGGSGTGALQSTAQASVLVGRVDVATPGTVPMSSAAVDAGSTPTTYLRAGLLLGKITSSGLYKAYDPASTDGSQVAVCVLAQEMSMLSSAGTAEVKDAHVALTGVLRASVLVNVDNMARRQLIASGKFLFDDEITGRLAFGGVPQSEVAKTADYTVVAADAGTLFTTLGASGAVNFTLPALAAGLGPFEFLCLADQNMTVTSAEGDNIVTDNDLSADSIAFSTASHKIGGHIQIWANGPGTKWYWRNMGPLTNTITIAT